MYSDLKLRKFGSSYLVLNFNSKDNNKQVRPSSNIIFDSKLQGRYRVNFFL